MSNATNIVDILLEVDFSDKEIDQLLKASGVTVTPQDFQIDSRQIGWPGGWTGNYTHSVFYKPIHYRGKPVYIGSITGTHDYNRTGHAGLVNYWAEPPRRTWGYNPKNLRTGKPIYKSPKMRHNFGYGNVHMNAPEGSNHFDNLFDACKWLLRLLKQNNKHLRVVEALQEAADEDMLRELTAVATNPLLVPKKTKVEFLRGDTQTGVFHFVVSLLRSRHSYRHFLGTLRRSALGEWSIESVPDVILRKHIQPYPEPDKVFPTDVAAEKALIKHIIDQFPHLLTPRW